jgi:hypothetical protein
MRNGPNLKAGFPLSALLLVMAASAYAQDTGKDIIPAFRDRAVVMDIVARVVEREKEEVWNSVSSKVTIPGRAVSIKLREDGRQVLVAQGQVWVNTSDEGIRYQTTMQTIPVDFGERVFFFPLGPKTKDGNARIEIQLELHPYIVDPGKPAEEGHQEKADPNRSGEPRNQ